MAIAQKNTLFYPEIWKKSFLIEIAYSSEPECFTFSLPPENFEHKMTQRLSKTPTFGGLFVDDYGAGVGSLRFSGSTGNSAFKHIYRNGKGDLWLTGKEELFYFRDRIARYKTSSAWQKEANPPPIYLYNLATNNSTDGAGNGSAFVDAWEVLLEDFTITQNKDKPFTYNYAIDFTVVRLIGDPDSKAYNRESLPRLTAETIAGWNDLESYQVFGQAAVVAFRAAAAAAGEAAAAAKSGAAAARRAAAAQAAGDAQAEAEESAVVAESAAKAAEKAREAKQNADNASQNADIAATQARAAGNDEYADTAEGASSSGKKAGEDGEESEQMSEEAREENEQGNYAQSESKLLVAEESAERCVGSTSYESEELEYPTSQGPLPAPAELLPEDIPQPNRFLEAIKAGLDFIEEWHGHSEDLLRSARDVRARVDWYCAETERYVGMVTGFFENGAAALGAVIYSATDIYSSFKRITMAPAEAAMSIVRAIKDMKEAVYNSIEDMKSLPIEWTDAYGGIEGAIKDALTWGDDEDDEDDEDESGEKKEVNNIYTQNTEEVIQSIENAANALCVVSVSLANPHVIIFPGANGKIERIVAHGYLQIVTTSETTLEQLAATYLGNPDMAQVIALINGIASDEAISPGDVLVIPALSSDTPISLVFNKKDRRDAIGTDIAHKNGKFAFSGGDFAVVAGDTNIEQAIGMRLAESIGNRMRLSVYGIRNVAGMPSAVAAAYIATSVKDTVLQDPRIDRIENLYFSGSRADALYIEFDYYTINGTLQKYQGGI